MELVGLVHQFEIYLREDLDYGDDRYEFGIIQQFKNIILSKIKVVEDP